ncbi:MAG TPA: gluconate 2-dehydrogenase subunit 3 family protein [Alphaproteobacteria bacterium]|nr:gluconate 2-dehydrogenase subunit 3 family protein [Alphaproteobacteria bacterium]
MTKTPNRNDNDAAGLSRRSLFKTAGAVGVAAAVPSPVPGQENAGARSAAEPAGPPTATGAGIRFFLTEPEALFVAAAADRLIPPDETWPGAAWAGVPEYIDRQLAGGYGQGARMFLDGPWQEGLPQQGYQLRYTPAEIFRVGIAAVRRHVAEAYNGREFYDLAPEVQDEVLKGLETGTIKFEELPAPLFFETLLAKTVEGYFADPAYGGNRDMTSWRMIGFPGAYAQFAYLVEEWGMTYDRPPMSIAQSAAAHHDHD